MINVPAGQGGALAILPGMDVNRLKTIPLFAAYTDDELSEVAPQAQERDVPAGAQLTNGHEELVLIDEGTAEVWQAERHVADLGPGDYFVAGAMVVAELARPRYRARSRCRAPAGAPLDSLLRRRAPATEEERWTLAG